MTRSCIILTVASLSTHAKAGILSTSGDAIISSPPPSITIGAWESDDAVRVWSESSTTLASELALDHISPGLVQDSPDLASGSVPADTPIRSHMIRIDPVGSNVVERSGTVEFEFEILGVIIGSELTSTDSLLGLSGVTYNTNSFRGLELDVPGNVDSFEISLDRRRLDFNFFVGQWTDDIRVVTAVPNPGTIVSFAAALLLTRRGRQI